MRNVGIVALALLVYLIVVTATSSSSQVMFRLSMATGYTSVVLIGWALADRTVARAARTLGAGEHRSPARRRDLGRAVRRSRTSPPDCSCTSAIRSSTSSIEAPDARIPVRYDLFGFANWSGLAATALLVLLLLISNDVSLRTLGSRRWKAWQRWTYWAGALVVAARAGVSVDREGERRLGVRVRRRGADRGRDAARRPPAVPGASAAHERSATTQLSSAALRTTRSLDSRARCTHAYRYPFRFRNATQRS